MPIFLQIPSQTGSATQKGYQGWISIDSADLDINRSVKGRSDNRVSGTPDFHEIHITKDQDGSSSSLLENICQDQAFPKVNLHVITDNSAQIPVLKYELTDVFVSRLEIGIRKDAIPVEEASLNYRSIIMTHTEIDSKGKPKSPRSTGFSRDTLATL